MKLLPIIVLLAFAATTQAQQTAWVPSSIGGGFVVQAPKKMSPMDGFSGAKGAPKTMLIWRCHGPDADFVVVNGVDASLKDAKEGWVEGTLDGITNGSFADLTEQFETLTKGWPTVQITTKSSAAQVMTARTIKFNTRNIQLMAMYPANKPRPKSVDLFLASLQIPDSVGTGPLTHPWPDFNEYKLGDSGITALFPKKPEMHVEQVGTGAQQGLMTAYYANYVNQYYAAGYRVLPLGTVILPDDAKKARGFICDDTAASFGAISTKNSEARRMALTKQPGAP